MQVIDSISGMQQQARDWQIAGERIAFVPTMGNLHDGHIALIRAARKLGQRCVVSIFVNPKQFGPDEDFATYPRTFEADCARLEAESVDCVFAPSSETMYPEGKDACTSITVPEISDVLEGEYRPGFFTGVATVVNKLFNCVQPDVAVFGEKDFQQCLVIEHMVHDFDMPIKIVRQPTVREVDGLAMSSRNAYLEDGQRELATGIHNALQELVVTIRQHSDINSAVLRASQVLEQQGFEMDYLVVRRQSDLRVPDKGDSALVVLVAARLGTTRLIDNLLFELEIS